MPEYPLPQYVMTKGENSAHVYASGETFLKNRHSTYNSHAYASADAAYETLYALGYRTTTREDG